MFIECLPQHCCSETNQLRYTTEVQASQHPASNDKKISITCQAKHTNNKYTNLQIRSDLFFPPQGKFGLQHGSTHTQHKPETTLHPKNRQEQNSQQIKNQQYEAAVCYLGLHGARCVLIHLTYAVVA